MAVDLRHLRELNFFTTLRMARAAVVPMIERRSEAIVNVASVNAFFQPDGRPWTTERRRRR